MLDNASIPFDHAACGARSFEPWEEFVAAGGAGLGPAAVEATAGRA